MRSKITEVVEAVSAFYQGTLCNFAASTSATRVYSCSAIGASHLCPVNRRTWSLPGRFSEVQWLLGEPANFNCVATCLISCLEISALKSRGGFRIELDEFKYELQIIARIDMALIAIVFQKGIAQQEIRVVVHRISQSKQLLKLQRYTCTLWVITKLLFTV